MDLPSELQIEYKRLTRNLTALGSGWEESIARDLVASLRNWVQLDASIDTYFTAQGRKLRFPIHQKTRAEKRAFEDGSVAIYIPSTVTNGPLTIAQVSIHNRAVSQDGIRTIVAAGPDGEPMKRAMLFTDWLNTEVYEIKADGERIGISRKLYIERCANMLGGTHPASTYEAERNEQVFDEQIKEILNTQIAGIPLPWAYISEAANGVAEAFKPYEDTF